MQFHTLKRNSPNRKTMTVGRGGKRGKTSGRGTKGQKARAGHKIRPQLRDIIKKLPKRRGRGKNIFQSFQKKSKVVSIATLEASFNKGDIVSPTVLLAKGLVKHTSGVIPRVKILGSGEITKALVIRHCLISQTAMEKIKSAGGSIS